DARVRQIGDLGQDQQVVAAEALGGLPVVAVLVDALEGDVVPGRSAGLVLPDGGLDGADSNFRYGFGVCHDSHLLFLGFRGVPRSPRATGATEPARRWPRDRATVGQG